MDGFRARLEDLLGAEKAAAVLALIRSELDDHDLCVVPRVPGREMIKAAAKALLPGYRPKADWMSNKRKHAWRYQVMVEAGKIEVSE